MFRWTLSKNERRSKTTIGEAEKAAGKQFTVFLGIQIWNNSQVKITSNCASVLFFELPPSKTEADNLTSKRRTYHQMPLLMAIIVSVGQSKP